MENLNTSSPGKILGNQKVILTAQICSRVSKTISRRKRRKRPKTRNVKDVGRTVEQTNQTQQRHNLRRNLHILEKKIVFEVSIGVYKRKKLLVPQMRLEN